jgi:hypothetical protein
MNLAPIFPCDFLAEENETEKVIRDHWIIISGEITINTNRSLDIIGDVKFPEVSSFLTELPLTFNKVSGDFDISRLSLTTLKGAPLEVGGTFDCSYNELTSLQYLPKKMGCLILDNMISSLSTSGVNCNFNEVLMLFRTNIPNVGLPDLIVQNVKHIHTVLKYQNYYELWNSDNSLNNQKFHEIMEDIIDGLE